MKRSPINAHPFGALDAIVSIGVCRFFSRRNLISPTRQRQRAFTLTELLIVIAVVGIVGGIAIPQFIGMRSRAKLEMQVRSNTKFLRMALDQIKLDSGTYPPGGTYTWSLIQGNIQYPGPNPIPTFQPIVQTGSSVELKLTIPTGSLGYFVQVRDPVRGNHFFQVDQDGVETTF